jgi:hypothetical protein
VYCRQSRKFDSLITLLYSDDLSQAMVSFTNQTLKNIPGTRQIDLLEKYQAVTKDDVLSALRTHFLPLFDPSTSVAVVVTAPAKADGIGEGLKAIGFEVTQRVMEVDSTDTENSENGETGSESK